MLLMKTAYTKEERWGTVSNVAWSDKFSINGVQFDRKRQFSDWIVYLFRGLVIDDPAYPESINTESAE